MTFLSLLAINVKNFDKMTTSILIRKPTTSHIVSLGVLDLHGLLQVLQASPLQHVSGVVVLLSGV